MGPNCKVAKLPSVTHVAGRWAGIGNKGVSKTKEQECSDVF